MDWSTIAGLVVFGVLYLYTIFDWGWLSAWLRRHDQYPGVEDCSVTFVYKTNHSNHGELIDGVPYEDVTDQTKEGKPNVPQPVRS